MEWEYVIFRVEQIEKAVWKGGERGAAMKVEKVNENQILWSLDKEDLIRNKISFADFLTGTPRIRELFQEAIRQAEKDLSFQVDGYILNCQLREFNEEKITFAITKKEVIPEVPYLLGTFGSLDEVIGVSGLLSEEMELKNALYKLEDNYLLILNPEKKNEQQLAWCTVNMSEFTDIEPITPGQRSFIIEHGECIIGDRALQKLREIA